MDCKEACRGQHRLALRRRREIARAPVPLRRRILLLPGGRGHPGDQAALPVGSAGRRRLAARVPAGVGKIAGPSGGRAQALLSHIGAALGTAAPTIASLQSIYKRRSTLYEHQLWARLHAGIITDFDSATQSDLSNVLAVAAADAASIDELVRAAADWLYARKTLLPAERTLRDHAREAFARIEEQALAAVEAKLPRSAWPALVAKLYAKRRGRNSTTVVEWLKTAAGRHRPGTLADVLEEIALLREWQVQDWNFGEALSFQRQQ